MSAREEAYGRAALDRACAAIKAAPNGDQERTLHVQCYAIGGLVAGGVIDEREAYAALLDSGRAMPNYSSDKWTAAELERKVKASLKRGMASPRWPKDDRERRWRHSAPNQRNPVPEPPEAARRSFGATTTAQALAVWGEAVPILRTLARVYLTGERKLPLGPDFDDGRVLRWHSGERALVSLFRNILTDAPQAIQLTFISPDGLKEKRRFPNGKELERMFVGPVGGAAIKLDPDEAVLEGLHIGEGVETCIDGRCRRLRPIWALGGSGAIERFPVLAGVGSLTIIAENGCAASVSAVEKCGNRWCAARRLVDVVNPDDLRFKDLNDLRRNKRSAY